MKETKSVKLVLVELIQDILQETHKEPEKRKLNTQKPNEIQMACPCCGDSKMNPQKKRGVLYLDTFKYYCWNGDCNAKYWSVFKFLNHFGRKISNLNHLQEVNEVLLKSKKQRKHLTTLQSSSEYFEFLYNNSIAIEKIENHYGLMDAEYCEWGQEFLTSRFLTRYSDRIRFCTNKFGNKEVWIFNKIDENNHVVGLQIKNLDYGVKYLTKTFSVLHKELNTNISYPEINQDVFIEKINNFSVIFNIFNVDLEQTVTVFEGPLDSFFIKNSVATAGASKLKNFFDGLNNFRYWYDNDITGKKNTIDKVKKNMQCFLWKKFFTLSNFKEKRIKDLNELLIYIHNNNLGPETTKYLKESFSKNKYDIYNV